MDVFQNLALFAAQYPGGETAFTVLVFILVLSILVFVHEWGHYIAARSVGVFVEEFSIGFGPTIAAWRAKSGTNWKIGLLPLGGYVQMKGQMDGEAIATQKSLDTSSFSSKSLKQKAWIVIAGPLANFILAWIVYTGLMFYGETTLYPVVGKFHTEIKVAEQAGMQVGDRVRVVNDEAIDDWDALVAAIKSAPSNEIQMVVERDGALLPLLLIPQEFTQIDVFGDTHTSRLIGIEPDYNARFMHQFDTQGALIRGAERTWEAVEVTLKSLHRLVIGSVDAKHIAGPLGIADLASQSAQTSTYQLLLFLAIISINLGIINLLPIPILDGGHLLFFLIEAIKGSPVSEKAQEWSLKLGLGVLVLLLVFATSNDLRRQGLLESFAGADVSEAALQKESTAP